MRSVLTESELVLKFELVFGSCAQSSWYFEHQPPVRVPLSGTRTATEASLYLFLVLYFSAAAKNVLSVRVPLLHVVFSAPKCVYKYSCTCTPMCPSALAPPARDALAPCHRGYSEQCRRRQPAVRTTQMRERQSAQSGPVNSTLAT